MKDDEAIRDRYKAMITGTALPCTCWKPPSSAASGLALAAREAAGPQPQWPLALAAAADNLPTALSQALPGARWERLPGISRRYAAPPHRW